MTGSFLQEPAESPQVRALYDEDLADDGFVALRLAFSTVNDALGAQPDAQLAESLPSEVRAAVAYGRPVAQAPAS